jgi:transcription antitermination factor NusG
MFAAEETVGSVETIGLIDMPDLSEPIESQFLINPSCEYIYCMYVRTYAQQRITMEVPRVFPCRAINPVLVKRKWFGRSYKEISHSLIPGYIFLISNERMEASRLRTLDGVLNILHYGYGEYAMTEHDEQFVRWLLKYDGMIGLSKAFRMGDRIQVIEGPLKDSCGTIVRVDTRRQRAEIRLEFNGINWTSWLDFEWVQADGKT